MVCCSLSCEFVVLATTAESLSNSSCCCAWPLNDRLVSYRSLAGSMSLSSLLLNYKRQAMKRRLPNASCSMALSTVGGRTTREALQLVYTSDPAVGRPIWTSLNIDVNLASKLPLLHWVLGQVTGCSSL